MKEHKPIRTHC